MKEIWTSTLTINLLWLAMMEAQKTLFFPDITPLKPQPVRSSLNQEYSESQHCPVAGSLTNSLWLR